jgi:hypothetical protein
MKPPSKQAPQGNCWMPNNPVQLQTALHPCNGAVWHRTTHLRIGGRISSCATYRTDYGIQAVYARKGPFNFFGVASIPVHHDSIHALDFFSAAIITKVTLFVGHRKKTCATAKQANEG